jgi:aryl-alcohol dehydrogenase-like predicted oxidoreductase
MKTRKLGNSALDVPAIGLGCFGMSSGYGTPDDTESIATIHYALDNDVNFFDTSNAYGAGKNEELIGTALKGGRRQKAILATKFGNMGRGLPANGKPQHVMEACEKSLKRLGTDVIDLYLIHRIDTKTPIEETIGAMSRLVEQGKVRYIGLSEASMDTLRKAHAIHPVSALQTEYSLWTRDAETEFFPTIRELGITYVAYASLGRGFLTGQFRQPDDLPDGDRRHDHPRFHPDNMKKNERLLNILEDTASAKNCTPAQVALAWVLTQGKDILPIPGTKKRKWLKDNIAAVDISLSKDECVKLEDVFFPGVTAGLRYPSKQMASMNN